MPTAGERCLCSTYPKGRLSLVCPKSSLPAGLGSPSIDRLPRLLSGTKGDVKNKIFWEEAKFEWLRALWSRLPALMLPALERNSFQGVWGLPLSLSAMARPLSAPCRVRILLQACSGRIQLCDCLPGAASCSPEEQQGFSSLPSSRGCARHPCPANFWGWHLVRRVWRCRWCTASLLQAGSDSQGVIPGSSELVQLGPEEVSQLPAWRLGLCSYFGCWLLPSWLRAPLDLAGIWALAWRQQEVVWVKPWARDEPDAWGTEPGLVAENCS